MRNVNGKLIRVRSSAGNRSIVDYSNLKEKVGIGEELRQKAERLRAERLKDPDRDRKLVFPKNERVIKVILVQMWVLVADIIIIMCCLVGGYTNSRCFLAIWLFASESG